MKETVRKIGVNQPQRVGNNMRVNWAGMSTLIGQSCLGSTSLLSVALTPRPFKTNIALPICTGSSMYLSGHVGSVETMLSPGPINMSCVIGKPALQSLSLSYPKKDHQ